MLARALQASVADAGLVLAIDPQQLGNGPIPFAPAVAAGPWLFASGALAQDYATGIPETIRQPGAPYRGSHRAQREANFIYDRLEHLLAEVGGKLDDVVRVDQFYRDYRDVDPYHMIRKSRFGAHVPPSTSMLCSGLLLPDARAQLEAIAYIDAASPSDERHRREPILDGPASSGFSAALVAGDFVFIPGLTAGAGGDQATALHIHKSARVPAGTLWWGQNIVLETEFVIVKRIMPALELAGSSMTDVVKAQVFLTHVEDIPGFMHVWKKHFGASPPALTVIPSPDPSIGVADGRIEINIIALRSDGATRKHAVETDVTLPLEATPVAVHAGDLLFLSGLVAGGADGVGPAGRTSLIQPHYHCPVETQAEAVVEQAQAICLAAGASLANVVRIQQFHTDLGAFYPFARAWMRAIPGTPLPLSAVAQPALPIPDAAAMADLIVYAPQS